MKKTNYFRIQLFDGANSACETAVIQAAKSNGGDKNLTIKEIATITEGERLKWQILCPDTTVQIIDDNLLHIDSKINGQYKTVCIIENVEVLELKNENDIPVELFTGAMAE